MKIIWAVDPYQHSDTIEAKCAETIVSLRRGEEEFTVEPVYVVPPGAYYRPFELVYAPSYPLEKEALEEMRTRLSRYKVPGLLPPVVIQEPVAYVRAAVRALCEYAERQKGDVIVAGTHGRRGVARFFLGSFAETLTLYAHIPTLLVRAETDEVAAFKTLLLPIELDAFPYAAFVQACALARRFDAALHLLHVYREDDHIADLRQDVEGYVRDATDRGVRADAVFVQSGRAVSDEIIHYSAEVGVDLVVMEARSGFVKSTFAGSTTRQVVRGANCPVWVLRSYDEAAERENAA